MLSSSRDFCAIIALAGLAGCTADEPGETQEFLPDYRGIETQLLDGNLVRFLVQMKGARDEDDVADYAKCAASQYALIRGYGFARHVRTKVAKEGGLWRADAVYTISSALPRGSSTIDAEVTVLNCAETGIPTV